LDSNKKLVLIILGLVVGLIVILVGAGILASLLQSGGAPLDLPDLEALSTGDPAPEIALPSVNGELVRLSDFRGRPVLVSFGASWCVPCQEEVPLLQSLHDSQPEPVVLFVDVGEDQPTVQEFVDDYGITFTILVDQNDEAARDYGLYSIPLAVFIDKDGLVQSVIFGGLTKDDIVTQLELIGVEYK